MKVICAWCNKEIKAGNGTSEATSHGVCLDCKHTLLGQKLVKIDDLIQSFPFPVLLVDTSSQVSDASDEALQIFGKSRNQIRNLQGGEVLECMNAKSEEGCGKSIHCFGCTLRISVMKTMEDGIARYNIPTEHEVYSDSTVGRIKLQISVEKIGSSVLVLVEDFATSSSSVN